MTVCVRVYMLELYGPCALCPVFDYMSLCIFLYIMYILFLGDRNAVSATLFALRFCWFSSCLFVYFGLFFCTLLYALMRFSLCFSIFVCRLLRLFEKKKISIRKAFQTHWCVLCNETFTERNKLYIDWCFSDLLPTWQTNGNQ